MLKSTARSIVLSVTKLFNLSLHELTLHELTDDSMSFILTNPVDLHKLRSKHEYKSSAVLG